MRTLMKSSFLWQFVGGFTLGALGLVAVQTADAMHARNAMESAPIEASR